MPPREASLPMYNLPELRAANAALWDAIRGEAATEGLTGLPEALTFARPAVPEAIGPEVVFSQTCGYPLGTTYAGQYALLGVPSYNAPGCGPGTHRAFVLVREDAPYECVEDLRGATFALNSRHSNSGMSLPRALIAPLAGGRPFFGAVVETGTHPASMALVAAGGADAASIDCVTHALFAQHRPEAVARLRVLAATPDSPAIPFVTSARTPAAEVAALRRALARLGADPAHRATRAALRISAIGPADPATYAAVLDHEREAARLGYPDLA